MNNPKTEDVVDALRRCSLWKRGDCQSCPMKDVKRDEQNGVVFCAGNLMLLAADLIEQLQQELIDERYRHDRLQDWDIARTREQPRWIPVTERLPENNDDVLIMSSGSISMGYYSVCNEYWADYINVYYDDVTHWMPLPEPPKEDAHEPDRERQGN